MRDKRRLFACVNRATNRAVPIAACRGPTRTAIYARLWSHRGLAPGIDFGIFLIVLRYHLIIFIIILVFLPQMLTKFSPWTRGSCSTETTPKTSSSPRIGTSTTSLQAWMTAAGVSHERVFCGLFSPAPTTSGPPASTSKHKEKKKPDYEGEDDP